LVSQAFFAYLHFNEQPQTCRKTCFTTHNDILRRYLETNFRRPAHLKRNRTIRSSLVPHLPSSSDAAIYAEPVALRISRRGLRLEKRGLVKLSRMTVVSMHTRRRLLPHSRQTVAAVHATLALSIRQRFYKVNGQYVSAFTWLQRPALRSKLSFVS